MNQKIEMRHLFIIAVAIAALTFGGCAGGPYYYQDNGIPNFRNRYEADQWKQQDMYAYRARQRAHVSWQRADMEAYRARMYYAGQRRY